MESPGRLLSRSRLLLAGVAVLLVAVALYALIVLIPGLGDDGDQAGTPASASTATATPAVSSAGLAGSIAVLAHQGGWEDGYPLETLPALVAAAESGATVETDVHWTSDGVAILVHDERTTAASEAGPDHPMVCQGGPYTVSKTSWDVLRTRCRTLASASKDGRTYAIPTLNAALKKIAAIPDAQIVVEMKPEHPSDAQIREYLATIAKYKLAGRTISSSFYPDALAKIKALAAQDQLPLRFLLMMRPIAGQNLPTPDELSDQGLWGVALRTDIVTRSNISSLHAKKLAVVVWTANTVEQWNAAKQAEADLVLTDKPNAYRAWLP
ncbi:MAG TPA: glycerophosphodiester phosphodiesterase family protein [Kineosporiaceae bacterium]|nr:glycerophosphodiester phosphodiesterase family protein [Kineosporiaceae bacterium]